MPRFEKLCKHPFAVAILCAGLASLLSGSVLRAEAADSLASGRLFIQGARLSLYQDAQTADAEQTANAGEAVRIRTCYGAVPCGLAVTSTLRVRGELRGPELSQPVSYETVPGGAFFLPGFQVEGDYFLENIRLEEAGKVLGSATPSVAVIHVRKILLTEARVSRLTLEELRGRGISLNQENAQAYRFAIGFAFGSQSVTLEMPVLYQGAGSVEPLEKPTVNLDGLPPEVAQTVRRWEPPRIVPFKLDLPPSAPLDIPELGEEAPAGMPLFGAIVIPGSISFLNQFFDARLIVANGADAGSGVQLSNVKAALRLPAGGVLRLAATNPPVGAGAWLPVVGQSGVPLLNPTEQGSASWNVEGLVTGTHALRMEIAADLLRQGRPVIQLSGSAQAAVEVVDARFNLAFSHPDTVREGEAYSLFVTVTNLSRTAMNSITVAFGQITGAQVIGPPSQSITTLAAGGAETLEFRMQSATTGKCFATTFQTSSAGLTGSITLRTGVGELGIPLSPATLLLPRHARRLPPALLTANQRLLGLAYSLAVAPAGAAPQGLPHVIRSDVERRAHDLGEAGQRLFLTEPLLESLEVLALDQLGNRHDLAEFDALRRKSDKGREAAAALAAEIRSRQTTHVPALGALDFFDHFISTTSYSRPFLGAVLVPSGGFPAPVLELVEASSTGLASLAFIAEESGRPRLRDIPFGEIYALNETGSGGASVPFALIGRLDRTASYAIRVWASGGVDARGRLVILAPEHSGSGFVRVEFPNLEMRPGDVFEIAVVAPSASQPAAFEVRRAGSGIPVPGIQAVVQPVTLPPFQIVGAVQDFDLDPYGSAISYLFNRPPTKASAETPNLYQITTTSDVEEAPGGGTVVRQSTKTGAAAFWQPSSERVVNVRFTGPISPLSGGSSRPIVTHSHTVGSGLRDMFGNTLSAAAPPLVLEPGHAGGLAEGRVLDGMSNPIPAARVSLLRWRQPVNELGSSAGSPVLDLVSQQTTGAEGTFYFDFIEEPAQGRGILSGFVVRAETGGAAPEKEEVSSRIRLQGKLVKLNVAFLGRGTIEGRLLYDDGAPVTGGTVAVANTLFSEMKTTAVTGSQASFTVTGIPVGPVTVTGRDAAGNSGFLTVGLEAAGQVRSGVIVTIPHRSSPRTGTVVGRVLVLRAGSTRPAERARVALYANGGAVGEKSTDASGNFRFEKVPEGQVTVQAADFATSRSPAVADLRLAADQTTEATLTLVESVTRAVTGSVFFHEPAANTDVPVAGAVVFVEGPGNFAYSDATGAFRIENVPSPGQAESYAVTAIDLGRKLQGSIGLVSFNATAPDPISLNRILLRSMAGAIEGLVLDPLGRPIANAGVVLGSLAETTTDAQGRFVFDGVPVGSHRITAHSGDGLQPGQLGYFGATEGVTVVYGGHRAQTTVRMRGAGVVRITTKSPGGAAGVLAPLAISREAFLDGLKSIGTKTIEAQTDPAGVFEIPAPVGSFGVRASHPFHGVKSAGGTIDFPGQIKTVELTFDAASTVTGRVYAVDGATLVEGAEVFLTASGLLPQRLVAGPAGEFRFELVPPGSVSLTATARVGAVTRYGRVEGRVTSAGQTLDMPVVLSAQGTLRGSIRKKTEANGQPLPLPSAEYYVQESGYPNRRVPSGNAWARTNAGGEFEVAGVVAGLVTIVARDPGNVASMVRVQATISADFQIVEVPALVLFEPSVSLEITVTDPDTGAGVADTQIRLSTGETTVADASGRATFEALPYGTYSVTVFHAPTGRGGHLEELVLDSGPERVSRQVFLGARGRITGTLFDDVARTIGIGGATISLTGRTDGQNGPATFSALATTDGAAATRGTFFFDGIPAGTYTLRGAISGSARRAEAQTTMTPTSPQQGVDLVLEPVGDVHVRLYESLRANPRSEINPALGLYSVRLLQPAGCAPGTAGPTACSIDYTVLSPSAPYPSHRFVFPAILTSRSLEIQVQEATGEQRGGTTFGATLAGSGTAADPFQVLLQPRGTLRVEVKDAGGQPVAGAEIRVSGAEYSATFEADGQGKRNIYSVPRGTVRVSAVAPGPNAGLGGSTEASIEFDDDVKDVVITLSPSYSIAGRVHRGPAGGTYSDPSTLPGEPQAAVAIQGPVSQAVRAGSDGRYRFDGLAGGTYLVSATGADGVTATTTVVVPAPEGGVVPVPPIVLDGSRPSIVSLAPPPGMTGVSRSATVEIVFSEPLHPEVIAVPGAYFSIRSSSGTPAPGAWAASLDSQTRQIVRFTPGPAPNLLESNTIYAIQIKGGPTGVRDRAGNRLTETGDVGANFATADTLGPVVVGTVPGLDLPVEPSTAIRFDFNEAVTALPSELDGNMVDDAGELYYGQGSEPSVTWSRVPVELYLTANGYSLSIRALGGLSLPGDNGRRRIVVTRLRDSAGNQMAAPYAREYRVRDTLSPQLEIGFPAGSQNGQLAAGTTYLLSPSFVAASLNGPLPFGDVSRVEYFLASQADPNQPAANPAFVASAAPFSFSFTPAYQGDGTTPRPYSFWVTATDTSANRSNTVRLPMEVVPNQAPILPSVGMNPLAAALYAGSTVRVTVPALSDPDGSSVTLAAELRRENAANPNDPADILASAAGRVLTRPSGGWQELPAQTFDLQLPISIPEGTRILARARATDALGSVTTKNSATQAIADDTGAPAIQELRARAAGQAQPATQFFLGQRVIFELRASDAETRVKTVSIAFDGVFQSPVEPTLVSGDQYRTAELPIPPGSIPQGGRDVVVTAAVDDWGGNTKTSTLTIHVSPTSDPTAPVVDWVSPVEGGRWPASHVSVRGQGSTALLLRVRVKDVDRDGQGNLVPGNVVEVKLWGPGAAGVLAGAPVTASRVSGTDLWQAAWPVPDGMPEGALLQFRAEATDSGQNTTTKTLGLVAVGSRLVYENTATTVGPADSWPGTANVFILDGAMVSLPPRTGGQPHSVENLYLYAGLDQNGVRASTLTTPEITSVSSPVLFNPLNLEIGTHLGLGSGATIRAIGPLGSTSTATVSLPGIAAPDVNAGGSHGGLGGTGYKAFSPRTQPGPIYDSIRQPSLPGLGGRSSVSDRPGGAGGGVVLLRSADGTIAIEGIVDVSGLPPLPGFINAGGAGGTARITAKTLLGHGQIRANGGAAVASQDAAGGGGGGRIALSFQQPAMESLPMGLEASGGPDSSTPADVEHFAGAGTIFLQQLTADGSPAGGGKLLVEALGWKSSRITPLPSISGWRDGVLQRATVVAVDEAGSRIRLRAPAGAGDWVGEALVLSSTPEGDEWPGRIVAVAKELGDPAEFWITLTDVSAAALSAMADRMGASPAGTVYGRLRHVFDSVGVRGSARLVLDDDVKVGIAPGAVNDKSVMSIGPSAAVLLRNELPAASFVATPDGAVLPGTIITLETSYSHPIALASRETVWLGQPQSQSWPESVEHRALTSSGQLGRIPATQPPGPIQYKVKLTDYAGRVKESMKEWTVLPENVPPQIGPISITPVRAGNVYTAGEALTISVSASDNITIARIVLTVDGAIREFTASPATFVWVAPSVATPRQVEIRAEAFDQAGNSAAATTVITVNPIPNANPVVTASATPSSVMAGGTVTVSYTATDDTGLSSVDLRVTGAAEALETRPVTGTSATGTFHFLVPAESAGGAIQISVSATDTAGGRGTAGLITVQATPLSPIPAPTGELSEGNASNWQAFSEGPGGAQISNDTSRVRVGSSSLRFTMDSESVSGIRYTAPDGNAWDLRQTRFLSFWEFAESQSAFTGPQPVVILRGPSGTYRYEPPAARMTIGAWRHYLIPLSDLGPFVRTAEGSPSLARVRELELRHQAAGGYTITFDGIEFTNDIEGDLAEGNAVLWTPFADGGELVSSTLETIRTRSGASAIKFVTASGVGTGLRFAAGARPNWDLSGNESLYFYALPENPNPPGFQGMAVTLRGPAGAFRYTPQQLQLENGVWRLHEVPLSGDASWVREVVEGSPSLSSIDEIELWFDTWDYGFSVIVDGVSFGRRMPLLTVLPSKVPAGQPALAKVQLGQPAPPGGRTLSITSSDPAVALPGPLFVAEGRSEASFSVTTSGTEPKDVTLTWNDSGTPRSARLELTTLVLRDAEFAELVVFPGPITIEGSVRATRLEGRSLRVKPFSELRPLAPGNADGSDPRPLVVIVDGPLVVETGGFIHATGQGYGASRAYPGAAPSQQGSGGSHVGRGGQTTGASGPSFGSVYTPLESGAGNGGPGGSGGGSLYLSSGSLRVDGFVVSHGEAPGGAGGSVQIRTGTLSGQGGIGAIGADSDEGTGGGGAVSIVYASAEDGILERVEARAGATSSTGRFGGSGTIFLFGPGSIHGDLIVDNAGIPATEATRLPGIGSGIAQPGSSGTRLETGSTGVSPYFVNHWVQITDSGGTLKGTYRIHSVLAGGALELSSGAAVVPGDRWQGVYIFDAVYLKRGASFESGDPLLSEVPVRIGWTDVRLPLETAGPVEITGTVFASSITARSLTIKPDAQLAPRDSGDPAISHPLVLSVQEGLVLEPFSAINANGTGYGATFSYPGATPSAGVGGGTHLGLGGIGASGTAGSSFGSVYRPLEPGAGPGSGDSRGGGAIRISAGSITVPAGSQISAEGTPGSGPGGAGGSIWITTGELSGDGLIAARGADSPLAAGAGGAISVEYNSIPPGATILEHLTAHGGNSSASEFAGGGTILVRQTQMPHGALVVHGNGVTGGRPTLLPSLGSGTAQAGSGGALLRIAAESSVAPFFTGHWVELKSAAGIDKGRFRIASIGGGGRDLVLSGEPGVEPGDLWRGVYLFGSVTTEGGSTLEGSDPVLVVPPVSRFSIPVQKLAPADGSFPVKPKPTPAEARRNSKANR